jgi:hypothetical protein
VTPQAGSSQPLSALHEQLVQKYTRGGLVAPCDIQDDGYVLLNLVHHLLCAGDVAAARQLLLNPYWLEQKLLAYGSTSLVSDFRRCGACQAQYSCAAKSSAVTPPHCHTWVVVGQPS